MLLETSLKNFYSVVEYVHLLITIKLTEHVCNMMIYCRYPFIQLKRVITVSLVRLEFLISDDHDRTMYGVIVKTDKSKRPPIYHLFSSRGNFKQERC